MISPSISEDAVFTALGDFLSSFFRCKVIRGQVNRVPMPKGPFIEMDCIGKRMLATNSKGYAEDAEGNGSVTVMSPTEYRIQLDFYGDGAADRGQVFMALFNDGTAFHGFPDSIKPLYAVQQTTVPFITGGKEFLERWTAEVFLQFNPTVTLPVNVIEDIPVSTILANGRVIT